MNDRLRTSNNGDDSPVSRGVRSVEQVEAERDRIKRYAVAAVEESDDIESILGLVTARLLEITLSQQQLLESATKRFAESPRSLEQQHTVLDDYLRLTKQVERNLQLVIRSRESRNET